MPESIKSKQGSNYFRFDYPLTSQGIFFDNLTIEGYWCMENEKPSVDIDSVQYRDTEVKPLLEIFGGMQEVDMAAEAHVRGIIENTTAEELRRA
jgi:hypothetical protein